MSARVLLPISALLGACAAPPPPAPPPLATSAPAIPTSAPAASSAPPAVGSATPPAPEAPLPSSLSMPLPAGFTEIAEEGETACGAFRAANLREPGPGQLGFVRVRGPNGKVVYEAHGRTEKAGTDVLKQTIGASFCGDLTGDGVPELVMTESSMGAHCCYTHYVVSLTTPPKRILMWEKGDAATRFVPVKYRSGPAWQLQGWVVFWPPFNPEAGDPVLSYPSAPVIPAVLSLVNGAYALTSLSFPEAYRKDRDEMRGRCGAHGDIPQDLCDLFTWVDAVAIGDWETERAKVTDQELRQALDRRAAATRKKLEKELGSLAAPAPPSR